MRGLIYKNWGHSQRKLPSYYTKIITIVDNYLLLIPTFTCHDLMARREKRCTNRLSETQTLLPIRWRHVNNRTIFFILNHYSPDPLAPREKTYNSFHMKLLFK